jgi:exopolyphosphatase/guanosine-5'-triphosphate,3'-diphosphate pyrophosphatase
VEGQLGNERFAWQVLALRLAVIKCHARGLIDNKALRLRSDDRQARLSWRSGWAGGHPRTLHLLREEADAWARQPALRLALEIGA